MTNAVVNAVALTPSAGQPLPPTNPTPPVLHVRRFDRPTRRLHIVVMVTFLGLAATGLPLLFSAAPWSRVLSALFGGFHGAGLVHRGLGAILLGAVIWHVANMFWRAFGRGERGIFWGPTSMVPQLRDIVQLFQQIKWFLGAGPQPRFEHFTYWEKFDYWAVLWGTALMGAAGLVLWFPMAASAILPGWLFNVALFVHGAEATLAIGFIFVIHFFNGHLRPGKFPMDLVIFTGSVTEDELREERTAEYARLAKSGELGELAVAPPTAVASNRGHFIGAAGLTIGIALVVLMIYAVLRG
jgi:cytochrome b subunit of formate dehydrogenase